MSFAALRADLAKSKRGVLSDTGIRVPKHIAEEQHSGARTKSDETKGLGGIGAGIVISGPEDLHQGGHRGCPGGANHIEHQNALPQRSSSATKAPMAGSA